MERTWKDEGLQPIALPDGRTADMHIISVSIYPTGEAGLLSQRGYRFLCKSADRQRDYYSRIESPESSSYQAEYDRRWPLPREAAA